MICSGIDNRSINDNIRNMMKKVLFWSVAFLLAGVLFSACKDMKGGKLLPVSGSSNELLVVMPENMWKGAMGDSVREFFAQDMVPVLKGILGRIGVF